MPRAHTLGALSLALAGAGCTAPGLAHVSAGRPDDDTTTTAAPATTDEPVPTTGMAPDPGTTGTTTTGELETTTTTGTTGDVPAGPPTIVEIDLVPNPLLAAGIIDVTVATENTDTVMMAVDDGDFAPLLAAGGEQFTGSIAFYSSKDNKQHTAHFRPERDGVPGGAKSQPFEVALPAGGGEIFWEAVDVLGKGYVAAVAVLPDGDVLEFGTLTDLPARCYLRRRTPQGAWNAVDVSYLSETPCTAIDLGVGQDGAIYLLADRTGVGDLSWWLAGAASPDAPLENLRFGAKGETAGALAMHPDRLAVCGTQPTPQLDFDAAAWIVGLGEQTGTNKAFDYKAPQLAAHVLFETPKDCAFSGDTLGLVGEAYGIYNPLDFNAPKLKRRFLLEFDVSGDTAHWTVDDAPNDVKQSGIYSLTIDGQGRYITGAYTCGYPCSKAQAELRMFEPGGAQVWQLDLSPALATPTDLAWSPAGYVVITSAVALGQWSSSFLVQVWQPNDYPAVWSYEKNVAPTLHMANSVAIGQFGQIYVGGVGANNYPAVAFIHP